jgi:hypothetical protein
MMASHLEIERLRGAFASLAADACARPGCPEPERIWRAAGGELRSAELRELVDHTAGCPSCAEDWRLAREIRAGMEPTAEVPARRPFTSGRTSRYLAAAAVLALAVGAWVWRSAEDPSHPTVYRAPEESALESLVPKEIPVPRQRFLLRWSSEERDARYQIRVATGNLEMISTVSNLDEPEYLVPEADLAGLPSGTDVLWQVEAVFPDGTRHVSLTFVNSIE